MTKEEREEAARIGQFMRVIKVDGSMVSLESIKISYLEQKYPRMNQVKYGKTAFNKSEETWSV